MPVLHEPVRLFIESKVSVSEAERSHMAIDGGLKLGRASSDSVVRSPGTTPASHAFIAR